MLEAKGISAHIGGRTIVHQVDVRFSPGKFSVILGPNGAGKSTLFGLLSGDQACAKGEVLYNAQPLRGLKAKALARVRAVMPQHSTLTFPFRVQEVVELGLLASESRRGQERVEEAMEACQVLHFRDKFYNQLSGGERQRVQLARVLTQLLEPQPFPRYLLLDEPISSMDIAQQHHILHLLKRMRQGNIAVIAILHDLSLAANYADEVVLLKKGELLGQGSTAEMMTSARLAELFDHPIEVSRQDMGMLSVHSIPHTVKNWNKNLA
ncbi:MAG: heme ABC transporter ATP-binding protein [Nitritalea sp.]